MKSFSQVIKEASAPKARVVLFGRMNPPTAGHEENVLAAHKIAQKHNAELHVVASHSQDAKKNPLTPAQKSTHLNRAFGHLPNTSISTSSAESPSILNQAAAAHKAGIRHFIMAGGGDRASSYHKLLKQYNGVQGKPHGFYKFDKISVANTGARKEGVSGTDMRRHAAAGDYAKFSQNLPSRIQSNPAHAKELFGHVQNVLHQKENIDRENYVQGLDLPLGSLAEDIHSGLIGKVVYRGPTYVTLQLDEDLSFKRWIKDVEVVDPADLPATPTYTFKGYIKDNNMDEFKNFINEQDRADKTQPEPALSETDLTEIEKHIDNMDWEEVKQILAEQSDADILDEDLSALQRINKRFAFMKTKAKRQIARRIALKRPSNQKKLKKKAVVHARKLIKAKILRGRDYSKLSAAEKNRIENVLKRASMAVVRISNRLIPKIREVEMKRLKMQEQAAEYPTDALVKHNTHQLAGHNSSIEVVKDPALDPARHVRKMKQFRKLEV